MLVYEERLNKTFVELEALLNELDEECEELAKKQLVLMSEDEWDAELITKLEAERMAYTKLRRQLTKHCPFLLLA